jgi:segregation and condensation protein B
MTNEQQDNNEMTAQADASNVKTPQTENGVSAEALTHNANLDNIILSVLFAAEEPVSIRKLTSIVGDVTGDDVREVLKRWREKFDQEAWSIRIEQIAGGYQLSTRPDYAPYVSRLYSGRRKFRLSRAGLEVLAIIAYKQPITRAEVENVRGVGCGGVIANLMERSLVKITGKARVLGAPFLYGTTEEFLEYLGLNTLRDLPSLEELESLLEKEAYPEEALEGTDGGQETQEGEEVSRERADEEAVSDFSEALEALEAARHAAIAETARKEPPAAASVAAQGEDTFAAAPAAEEDDDAEGTPSEIPTIEFEEAQRDDTAEAAESPEPIEDDEPRE